MPNVNEGMSEINERNDDFSYASIQDRVENSIIPTSLFYLKIF